MTLLVSPAVQTADCAAEVAAASLAGHAPLLLIQDTPSACGVGVGGGWLQRLLLLLPAVILLAWCSTPPHLLPWPLLPSPPYDPASSTTVQGFSCRERGQQKTEQMRRGLRVPAWWSPDRSLHWICWARPAPPPTKMPLP